MEARPPTIYPGRWFDRADLTFLLTSLWRQRWRLVPPASRAILLRSKSRRPTYARSQKGPAGPFLPRGSDFGKASSAEAVRRKPAPTSLQAPIEFLDRIMAGVISAVG